MSAIALIILDDTTLGTVTLIAAVVALLATVYTQRVVRRAIERRRFRPPSGGSVAR